MAKGLARTFTAAVLLTATGCASVVSGTATAPSSISRSSADTRVPFAATFDHEAVEDGVRKVLTEDYNRQNVTDVSCPADQVVEPGHTFSCTVTIRGRDRTVLITVMTEDGEYEVGWPG